MRHFKVGDVVKVTGDTGEIIRTFVAPSGAVYYTVQFWGRQSSFQSFQRHELTLLRPASENPAPDHNLLEWLDSLTLVS